MEEKILEVSISYIVLLFSVIYLLVIDYRKDKRILKLLTEKVEDKAEIVRLNKRSIELIAKQIGEMTIK